MTEEEDSDKKSSLHDPLAYAWLNVKNQQNRNFIAV